MAREDQDFQILNCLEDKEFKLLSWGLVDGGFGDEEFLDLLDDIAEQLEDDRTAEEIRESLKGKALITEVRYSTKRLWRTRMAETVRLLFRLRQLFPKHRDQQKWRSAPTLVSDYRFVAKKRRFPKRDVPAKKFIEEALANKSQEFKAPLEALTKTEGEPLMLAPFQVRSTERILRSIGSSEPTATLVSAGTGSGKTKAVYLPALAHLASISDPDSWTKMLALYPRNELIKDQLRALLLELRLLKKYSGKSLSVGVWYGDTPFNTMADKWRQERGRKVCPFLKCLSCESNLYLLNDGGLECSSNSCSDVVKKDELILTREQMQGTPPDVLLTSVETLNRRINDDWSKHVFGVGPKVKHPPRVLLLDEVHVYSGIPGAQVTHLLRRWRHAVGSPVHTVGLSATITDGDVFFSQLASVHQNDVTVVEPKHDEYLNEGKEYLIALRGNPASATSLMSTTIQAIMLLRRSLDLLSSKISKGAYGSKLFAFTDNLDITNRFVHFLRNAEGQTDNGKPDPNKTEGSLANLRHSALPDRQSRIDDGQDWEISTQIGHPLDTTKPLKIERTSSQDHGFDKTADVVIATASLEVGLDDDTVGAVVQHKAPRDAASFLQRKGRAGRTRQMRPWTAVVLSDYGRDRIAFQAWDTLFDPQVPSKILPTSNRYILRIQATHVLLDWLSEQIYSPNMKGTVWSDLTGPKQGGADLQGNSQRRAKILECLKHVTESRDLQDDFSNYLKQSLQITDEEASRLLWMPPRGVFSVVVPTLIRRLESGWKRANSDQKDIHSPLYKPPLPDFLPSATFEDLLLPEIGIVIPSVEEDTEEDTEEDVQAMGVESALREFLPGKVTHRFATQWTGDRLWIPVSSDSPNEPLDPDDFFVSEPLGTITVDTNSIRVLRPHLVKPENPPREVRSSSNAMPIWRSSFDSELDPLTRKIPDYLGFSKNFSELGFFFHQNGNPLIVNRCSLGAEGSISLENESKAIPFKTEFVDSEGPVALGYRLEVDGISFKINDPDDWGAALQDVPLLERSLHKDWFIDCIKSSSLLRERTSIFVRERLAELSLSSIIEKSRSGVPNLVFFNSFCLALFTEARLRSLISISSLRALDTVSFISLFFVPNFDFLSLFSESAFNLLVALCSANFLFSKSLVNCGGFVNNFDCDRGFFLKFDDFLKTSFFL